MSPSESRDPRLAPLRNAHDVSSLASRLFGQLPSRNGVFLTAAATLGSDGRYRVLPASRACAPHAFAQALGRARSDAIVTLDGGLQSWGDGEKTPIRGIDPALRTWRQRRGWRRPATLAVLSPRRDLDLAHPVFTGDHPVVVFTGNDAPRTFALELADRGAMLVTLDEPTLHRCLQHLRTLGAEAMTLDSSIATLDDPVATLGRVDELVLSVREQAASPADDGTAWLSEDALATIMKPRSLVTWRDGSVTWTLRRMVRRASGAFQRDGAGREAGRGAGREATFGGTSRRASAH